MGFQKIDCLTLIYNCFALSLYLLLQINHKVYKITIPPIIMIIPVRVVALAMIFSFGSASNLSIDQVFSIVTTRFTGIRTVANISISKISWSVVKKGQMDLMIFFKKICPIKIRTMEKVMVDCMVFPRFLINFAEFASG